jgi:5-methylcytosine-specific restriction protein A
MALKRAWDHGGKTRQQRGYGKEHERIRAELMRDVVYCQECSKRTDARRFTLGTHADHIIPLAKGGTCSRSNYQLLCAPCHALKSIHDQGKNPRLRRRRRIDVTGWPIEEE